MNKEHVVCTDNAVLLALRKKEILSRKIAWMNLEDIVLGLLEFK